MSAKGGACYLNTYVPSSNSTVGYIIGGVILLLIIICVVTVIQANKRRQRRLDALAAVAASNNAATTVNYVQITSATTTVPTVGVAYPTQQQVVYPQPSGYIQPQPDYSQPLMYPQPTGYAQQSEYPEQQHNGYAPPPNAKERVK